MALKTRKQINKKIDAIYRWKWECLRRKPGYEEAWDSYTDSSSMINTLELENEGIHVQGGEVISVDVSEDIIKKNQTTIEKLRERMRKLEGKYDTDFFIDPAITDSTSLMKSYNKAVAHSDGSIFSKLAQSHGRKYKTFLVDIWRDKEIILREFSEWIDNARKTDKEKTYPPTEFDKVPHSSKIDRYLKVFDCRHQKPPMPYRQIAAQLKKEGYYKGRGIVQAENMAVKDFKVVYKAIYGVPYKKTDRAKFIKSHFKGCRACPGRRACKEPCAELEYILSEEEGKQQHLIGSKDVSEWTNK